MTDEHLDNEKEAGGGRCEEKQPRVVLCVQTLELRGLRGSREPKESWVLKSESTGMGREKVGVLLE